MEFARPDLLLLVPLMWAVMVGARRWRGRAAVLRWSSKDLLRGTPVGWRARLRPVMAFLPLIAAGLLGVALAQPRLAHDKEVVKGEGIDIAMVLDISGSMRALDFEPDDRLGVAKRTIREFVAGRAQDRISLVVFAASRVERDPARRPLRILLSKELVFVQRVSGDAPKWIAAVPPVQSAAL